MPTIIGARANAKEIFRLVMTTLMVKSACECTQYEKSFHCLRNREGSKNTRVDIGRQVKPVSVERHNIAKH